MIQSLQNSQLDLDELDLMLIRELEQDARVSYLALGAKLGASRQTVQRRINRLIDGGIITITSIPDHAALGYGTVLTMAINAPTGMVNALAQQLASIKEVKHVWITAGHYDIMAMALYRSPEEYLRSFPQNASNIPGNVRIETLLSVKLIKSHWRHLTEDIAAVDSRSLFMPTELDVSVMRGLEGSPRATLKQLAHDIGVSHSSVRSSYRNLTSRGIIRVVSVNGPADFERNIRVNTLVQAHPSSLNTLARTLKDHPAVQQMAITFGAFNCVVYTSFPNSAQMSDFLSQYLGSIPGVVHYESLITLKFVKRSFALFSDDSSGTMTSPDATADDF